MRRTWAHGPRPQGPRRGQEEERKRTDSGEDYPTKQKHQGDPRSPLVLITHGNSTIAIAAERRKERERARDGGQRRREDRRRRGFLKRRTVSTSAPPITLSIANCLVARVERNTMYLPIKISSEKQKEIEIVEEGFLDCGATGKFIDQNYARTKGLKLEQLEKPMKVYNVDGTQNKRGTIRQFVDLNIEIHGKTCKERFLATGLGKHRIILGYPWLSKMNPIIDWKKGTLEWRKPKQEKKLPEKEKRIRTPATIVEIEDEDKHLNSTQNPLDDDELSLLISSITGDTDNSAWINSKSTTATQIQAEINKKKEVLPLEEQIPKEFHDFLDVFSEEKAARFPEPRSWDHKIEMKESFVPKSFKTYNLTPQEQIELDKFLKENLEKGYIRPSQSPMASPFFFVDKKDGKL